MRNVMAFPTIVSLVVLLTSGCAGPEEKLGRGMSNVLEVARMGEMRRSIEQTAVLDTPEAGYTVGAVRGFNRTLARTGLGVVEIVTFPFPPYHPLFTSYLSPQPAFPASYKPGLPASSLFDTDTYTGFSGGDVAPFVPGSRFTIFGN